MSKIRVHELAKELGRQNKEVIECLKSGGVDVKSHMSNVDEAQAAMVKQKFRNMGKEQMTKLDTPKTEEKVTAVNAEAETPKKKKNIIRVFHAQNASDGGKNRKKPAGDKKTARPQGNNEKRQQNGKAQETKAAPQGNASQKQNEGAGSRPARGGERNNGAQNRTGACLLYTSDAADE